MKKEKSTWLKMGFYISCASIIFATIVFLMYLGIALTSATPEVTEYRGVWLFSLVSAMILALVLFGLFVWAFRKNTKSSVFMVGVFGVTLGYFSLGLTGVIAGIFYLIASRKMDEVPKVNITSEPIQNNESNL